MIYKFFLGIFFVFLVTPAIAQAPDPLCSSDSDCSWLCDKKYVGMWAYVVESYDCQVKSCLPKCEIFPDGHGQCRPPSAETLELYQFDEDVMIQKAKEFVVSYVGEDYFNSHYSLNTTSFQTSLPPHTGRGRVEFSFFIGDYRFDSNFIDVGLCEDNYFVETASAILERIDDPEISREEAIKIAEKEGLEQPFDIRSGLESGRRETKEGLIRPYSTISFQKPVWLISKDAEYGKKTLTISMIDGEILYRYYSPSSTIEASDGSANTPAETYWPFIIFGAVIILLAAVLIVKKRYR